ncbi:MAG: putative membrane protein [Arenicella sp.]
MSKKIHPIVVFLSKFSLPLLAVILLAYIYALLVARDQFPQLMFILFLSLGLIALGLIFKGVYQSKFAKGQADKEIKNSNKTKE